MNWRNDKKKELWEKDLSPIKRFKINAGIWLMKYQRRTHGLGILFLLLIGILLFSAISDMITTLLDKDSQELINFKKRVICMEHDSCIWGVFIAIIQR